MTVSVENTTSSGAVAGTTARLSLVVPGTQSNSGLGLSLSVLRQARPRIVRQPFASPRSCPVYALPDHADG